jgi:uncharacterized repeat protein (TIGR02543 family)
MTAFPQNAAYAVTIDSADGGWRTGLSLPSALFGNREDALADFKTRHNANAAVLVDVAKQDVFTAFSALKQVATAAPWTHETIPSFPYAAKPGRRYTAFDPQGNEIKAGTNLATADMSLEACNVTFNLNFGVGRTFTDTEVFEFRRSSFLVKYFVSLGRLDIYNLRNGNYTYSTPEGDRALQKSIDISDVIETPEGEHYFSVACEWILDTAADKYIGKLITIEVDTAVYCFNIKNTVYAGDGYSGFNNLTAHEIALAKGSRALFEHAYTARELTPQALFKDWQYKETTKVSDPNVMPEESLALTDGTSYNRIRDDAPTLLWQGDTSSPDDSVFSAAFILDLGQGNVFSDTDRLAFMHNTALFEYFYATSTIKISMTSFWNWNDLSIPCVHALTAIDISSAIPTNAVSGAHLFAFSCEWLTGENGALLGKKLTVRVDGTVFSTQTANVLYEINQFSKIVSYSQNTLHISPAKYALSYFDGGAPIESEALPSEYYYTEELTLLAAVKAGYTFSAWHSSAALNDPVTKIDLRSRGDKTLYAAFSLNTDTPYTARYYLETLSGGYEAVASEEMAGTTGASVTIDERTYPGFTFDGTNGDNALSGQIAGDGSLILKRYYKRNAYAVTVAAAANGGVLADKTSGVKYGERVVLTVNPAIGYELDALAVVYGAEIPVTVTDGGFTMPDGAVTVTPSFALVPYTITYHLNGGSGESGASYTVVSEAFDLPAAQRVGHLFGGWYDNAQFSGTKITRIESGSTGDRAFFAKWTIAAYTVTVETNGMEAIVILVLYNGTLADSGQLARAGFALAGLYLDADRTRAFGFDTPITGDTVLYADWEALKEGGCGNAAGGGSLLAVLLAAAGALLLIKRGRKAPIARL